jgi:hypothetical protein
MRRNLRLFSAEKFDERVIADFIVFFEHVRFEVFS